MSSSPRPNRNVARTTLTGRRPAVFSDTNVPRNRGPTNWPCRQEFSHSPIQRNRNGAKDKSVSWTWSVFSICGELMSTYFHRAGWSSLVARQAHNLKVAGSNPAPATNFFEPRWLIAFMSSEIARESFILGCPTMSRVESNNTMQASLGGQRDAARGRLFGKARSPH